MPDVGVMGRGDVERLLARIKKRKPSPDGRNHGVSTKEPVPLDVEVDQVYFNCVEQSRPQKER